MEIEITFEKDFFYHQIVIELLFEQRILRILILGVRFLWREIIFIPGSLFHCIFAMPKITILDNCFSNQKRFFKVGEKSKCTAFTSYRIAGLYKSRGLRFSVAIIPWWDKTRVHQVSVPRERDVDLGQWYTTAIVRLLGFFLLSAPVAGAPELCTVCAFPFVYSLFFFFPCSHSRSRNNRHRGAWDYILILAYA